jgi:hypothetical protein
VCRITNLIASYGRFSAAFPYLSTFLTSTGVAPTPAGPAQGTLTANPNPITLAPGQRLGTTTLRWQVTGTTHVQIRIGSATGPVMTGIENPVGSAATGQWVLNGMVFYLQDAGDGNSSGAAKTIATVRVQVR